MEVKCKNTILKVTKKELRITESEDTEKIIDIDPIIVVAKMLRRIANMEDTAS
jgi:hypothetical protein